ncbi:MarR family transcriptional regulator [Pigmentiphaga sp. H8]|uniref:MarR family winged helix-turn-helix transcriptional regulator n=1 Tax=unclassified Pigmentiphaga TaxID=2626614 RepID=UPI000F5A3CBC|nr:MarR family winged helix-turn-helix transcriptional regulator [Pigmentiphaga sp. H8]AZG06625.1 MarR family transcriptional regulator [Pigmentiphaga sp. H8]
MPPKKKASLRPPSTGDHPWTDIDEQGTGLSVDDFITTLVVRTGNSLRRVVTLPYSDQFGLTMAEWRMLSVVAEAQCLPFSELVTRSETDKSLVSRAMRLLETRGLVILEPVAGSPRRGLTCRLSADGQALYDRAMPVAQRAQAAMIRVLDNEEREVLYRTLHKLRRACHDEEDTLADDGQ